MLNIRIQPREILNIIVFDLIIFSNLFESGTIISIQLFIIIVYLLISTLYAWLWNTASLIEVGYLFVQLLLWYI